MCKYNHLHSAATIAANILTTKSYLIHYNVYILYFIFYIFVTSGFGPTLTSHRSTVPSWTLSSIPPPSLGELRSRSGSSSTKKSSRSWTSTRANLAEQRSSRSKRESCKISLSPHRSARADINNNCID